MVFGAAGNGFGKITQAKSADDRYTKGRPCEVAGGPARWGAIDGGTPVRRSNI